MIVCTKCHGMNDEVMDMQMTMYVKYDKIQNLKCLVCDELTLESHHHDGTVFLVEERTGFFDTGVQG